MCSTKLGDLKDNRSRGWHYSKQNKQGRETVTDFVASTATTAAVMLSMSLVTAKHLQLRQLSPPHNGRSSSLSVARRNELKSEQRTSTVLGSLSFVVFVRLFHCAFLYFTGKLFVFLRSKVSQKLLLSVNSVCADNMSIIHWHTHSLTVQSASRKVLIVMRFAESIPLVTVVSFCHIFGQSMNIFK